METASLNYIRTLLRPLQLNITRHISSEVVKERVAVLDDKETALYVHWPYCARKCTYCNFNKYVSNSVDHARMTECLVTETKTLLQLSGISRVKSVFFGGGTPSLAMPSTVGKIIDTVIKNVTLTEGSEVTLEANPTHLETSKLRDFQHAGVNRLSIGIQALNSNDLKFLGRDHTVHEALRCVEEAKLVFPDHVSVDLMFGRPGQRLETWTQELNQVVGMDVNHVSLYQLTVERGTQLFKWVDTGQVVVPDNDVMADMYTEAVQVLERHGLEQYEISNFARKGFECKHNQAYWHGSQYIGVGPGAHGRFTPINKHSTGSVQSYREARIQTPAPNNWMREVERFGHATNKVVPLSTKDRLEELLCSALRTKEGVTSENWTKIYSSDLFSALVSSERCRQFVKEGLLNTSHSVLRATPNGMLILDSLLPHLLYTLVQLCEVRGVT